MPRRSLLTAVQLETLFAFPDTEAEIAQHYMLDERDLAIIRPAPWRARGATGRASPLKKVSIPPLSNY